MCMPISVCVADLFETEQELKLKIYLPVSVTAQLKKFDQIWLNYLKASCQKHVKIPARF